MHLKNFFLETKRENENSRLKFERMTDSIFEEMKRIYSKFTISHERCPCDDNKFEKKSSNLPWVHIWWLILFFLKFNGFFSQSNSSVVTVTGKHFVHVWEVCKIAQFCTYSVIFFFKFRPLRPVFLPITTIPLGWRGSTVCNYTVRSNGCLCPYYDTRTSYEWQLLSKPISKFKKSCIWNQ